MRNDRTGNSVLSDPVFIRADASHLDWLSELEKKIQISPWSRQNFRDALASSYGIEVMQLDQVNIAFFVVLIVLDEAHLLNFGVDPGYQNRGMGQLCMHYLIKYVRERSCRKIFLEVRSSNLKAYAVYKKFSFKKIGERKNYYALPSGGRENAIVMEKQV